MELIHDRNRKYKGQWVYKGMPVENYTQKQADRMVQCGQAYWRRDVTMDNSKDEIRSHLKSRNIPFTKTMNKQQLLNTMRPDNPDNTDTDRPEKEDDDK